MYKYKYEYLKSLFNDYSKFINKDLYKFLFALFSKIFLNDTDIEGLDKYIQKINEKLIKNENKYINTEYNIKNFNNIIHFVKGQNMVYAGDIIESILIIIFSFAFKTDKGNTFGKYIYNNLYTIRKKFNFDLAKWFQENKLKPKELRDMYTLLENDNSDYVNYYEYIKRSPFFFLLFTINKEKYNNLCNANTRQNKKVINYINRGTFDSLKTMNKYFYSLKNEGNTIYEKDIIENSISNIISNVYFPENMKKIDFRVGVIREFLISVYIYYQNKNSPLMKYIPTKKSYENEENKKNLSDIPFEYNLNGAYAEGRFSSILLNPAMIEPRISKITIPQNNLRECGLYDISKVLLFNKNIKNINCNTSLIKPIYLDLMNFGLGIFNNNTLEYLDLSFNYLRENCEHYLTKLICHFQGLKTLNLSRNEIKKGFTSFFIVLKKLYRKGKTKLENLIINRCLLDDSSFYELGELLKCKYCKLKKLYLNYNKTPENINFLKKLKYNKSLTEIYLIDNDINNNDVNDIMKIISNTHIRYLYLYKNEISNFKNCLRIIYRTKIIQDNYNNKKKVDNKSFLTNLDLSDNKTFIINSTHIKFLTKIINESTLNCLDISRIIYGDKPNKNKITKEMQNYKKSVDELLNKLDKDKKNYTRVISELKSKNIDIKRLQNEEDKKTFKNLDDKINEIIKSEKAIFPIYLKKNAKILIKDENIQSININDTNNKKDIKQIEQNLVNYMKLKRTIKDVEQLEEERKAKKLILL